MIFKRRKFMAGAGAFTSAALIGHASPAFSSEIKNPEAVKRKIDKQVVAAKKYLFENVEGASELKERASGILIMPLITQAGLLVGGAHGRGALQVNDETVAYYSSVKGSWGLQIGIQQYAHALFFLTNSALDNFLAKDGTVSIGANLAYASKTEGGDVSFDTNTSNSSIVAIVFAQAGVLIGITLKGTAYRRLDI